MSVLTSQREGEPDLEVVRTYYTRRFPHLEPIPTPFQAFLGPEGGSEAWRKMAARFGDDLAALDRGTLPRARAEALMDYVLDEFAADVVRELEERDDKALAAFRRADLFCYTSGTMLNYGRAGKREFWRSTLQWALPLVVARRLGLRYGVYANSFEMLAPPSDHFYRRLLGDAAFLSFRDGESLKYVASLGIQSGDMCYRPDSAFFFPHEDDGYAQVFLERHRLEPERFIAVIIRTGSQPGPLENVMPREREERHTALLRAFIEAWVEKTGLPVLLCPEVKTEIEPMRHYIYSRLSDAARERSVWMDTFWMPDEAKAVYRRARIVCSMEVHSIVHALAAGTPVLHPQFWESGRKAWMLRDLGLEDWLLDIDAITPEELLAAALAIHGDFARAKARVKEAQALIERLGDEAVAAMFEGTPVRTSA